MNTHSIVELQDALDTELGWRKLELASLKGSVDSADGLRINFWARAGVALAYAHWEGFIKRAATSYLAFVLKQRQSYKDLHPCFAALGLRKNLNDFSQQRVTATNIEVVKFACEQMNSIAAFNPKQCVELGGNLSSATFGTLLITIGLDSHGYAAKANFIDKELLAVRHRIAHGERESVGREEVLSIIGEVLNLLDSVKRDIEVAASEGKYLRIAPVLTTPTM